MALAWYSNMQTCNVSALCSLSKYLPIVVAAVAEAFKFSDGGNISARVLSTAQNALPRHLDGWIKPEKDPLLGLLALLTQIIDNESTTRLPSYDNRELDEVDLCCLTLQCWIRLVYS